MGAEAKIPTTPPASEPAGPVSSTLDRLIAEQGVSPLIRFEDLFGAGRELWTEDEFAAFLDQIRATRAEGA